MMERILIFFLVTLAFTSCEKDVIKISFRMEPSGFYLDESVLDSNDSPIPFTSRYSGGYFSFANGKQIYRINTARVPLDEFDFELPVGEYLMECTIKQASPYGQSGASFSTPAQQIIIADTTTTIKLKADPTCSLLLINDHKEQLSEPPYIIERFASYEGFFIPHRMHLDSVTGMYYAYFSPDPQPDNLSAFLWFYGRQSGNETGGFSTVNMNTGKIYRFEILE